MWATCPFDLINIINSLIFQKNMPKTVEIQVRRRIEAAGPPQSIDQLCLDGIEIGNITPAIKRLIQGCCNLEYLTLNNCSLRDLDHLPALGRLIGLQLEDNMLGDNDLAKLKHSQLLHFLSLRNNRISSPQAFSQLAPLTHLEILELNENELNQHEDYRETIFQLLPSLNVIDCRDREGNMQEEDNASEYISNIGNSRLDLLEGDHEEKNVHGEVKTNTSYASDKLNPRTRKNSLDSALAHNSSLFSRFQHRPQVPQRSFLILRKQQTNSSDSQSQQGLIKTFKKMQKRQ